MGTKVGTKRSSGALATIWVVAFIVVLAYVVVSFKDKLPINGALVNDRDPGDQITLLIDFQPRPRQPGVRIIVTINAARVKDFHLADSPATPAWEWSITVKQTDVITLSGTQQEDGFLGCAIVWTDTRRPVAAGGASSSRIDPGQVRCYKNRDVPWGLINQR